jgi:hypothetical protein
MTQTGVVAPDTVTTAVSSLFIAFSSVQAPGLWPGLSVVPSGSLIASGAKVAG